MTSNVGKLYQFIVSNIFMAASTVTLIPQRFSEQITKMPSGVGISSLSVIAEHKYE